MANTFKKVQITATNNSPAFTQTNSYAYPLKEYDYLLKLKKYVEAHGFIPTGETELE